MKAFLKKLVKRANLNGIKSIRGNYINDNGPFYMMINDPYYMEQVSICYVALDDQGMPLVFPTYHDAWKWTLEQSHYYGYTVISEKTLGAKP